MCPSCNEPTFILYFYIVLYYFDMILYLFVVIRSSNLFQSSDQHAWLGLVIGDWPIPDYMRYIVRRIPEKTGPSHINI